MRGRCVIYRRCLIEQRRKFVARDARKARAWESRSPCTRVVRGIPWHGVAWRAVVRRAFWMEKSRSERVIVKRTRIFGRVSVVRWTWRYFCPRMIAGVDLSFARSLARSRALRLILFFGADTENNEPLLLTRCRNRLIVAKHAEASSPAI